VQLRLLQQRVVMTAQKAQADVLLYRLHYALPGGDAAAERRDAQLRASSTAQPRQGRRGLTATSMRTTALLSTAWAARRIRAGRAASEMGGGGGCARALAVYKPPPRKKRKSRWQRSTPKPPAGGYGDRSAGNPGNQRRSTREALLITSRVYGRGSRRA
jgi:hypothetical protein